MKSKVITILFILSTILLIISTIGYKISIVKKVILITGNSDIKGLQILENMSIFLVNKQILASRIINSNPTIKHVDVEKIIPATILMTLENRQPMAMVNNDRGKAYIDEEGIYLTNITVDKILPLIDIAKIPIYPESHADWRVIKALTLLKYLSEGNISIGKIMIDDNQNMYTLTINNSTKVLIPYNADASKLAASLQIIISRFRIEGKSVSSIDFRYDKPVIVLSNEVKKSSL